MIQLSFEALLQKFDPQMHSRLTSIWQLRPDVTALVVFENKTGKRTALMLGPTQSYQTLQQIEGRWLGDKIEDRQYPVSYCLKSTPPPPDKKSPSKKK